MGVHVEHQDGCAVVRLDCLQAITFANRAAASLRSARSGLRRAKTRRARRRAARRVSAKRKAYSRATGRRTAACS